jgi:hypothetical protein
MWGVQILQEQTSADHMDVGSADIAGANICRPHGCGECGYCRSKYLPSQSMNKKEAKYVSVLKYTE